MNKPIVRIICAAAAGAIAVAAAGLAAGPRIAAGCIVGIPSLSLLILSRVQLGKSFAVTPQAKVLVTKGLYSKFQHPMYVFLDLTLASLFVIIGWPWLFVVWGALVAMQAMRARQEEKVLAGAFGDEYEAYRRGTWL